MRNMPGLQAVTFLVFSALLEKEASGQDVPSCAALFAGSINPPKCCVNSPEGFDYSDDWQCAYCTCEQPAPTCTCCPTGYYKCQSSVVFRDDYCCPVGTYCNHYAASAEGCLALTISSAAFGSEVDITCLNPGSGQDYPSCDLHCCMQTPEGTWIQIDFTDECTGCSCESGSTLRTCPCCATGTLQCSDSSYLGGDYCCPIGTFCVGAGNCAVFTSASSVDEIHVSCEDTHTPQSNGAITTTRPISGSTNFTVEGDRTLTITVDNFLEALYFDGEQVPASWIPNGMDSLWEIPDVVPLPADVKLIAVQARNVENFGFAGILASDSLGQIWTNRSWKCTKSVYTDQWMMPEHSDAAWLPSSSGGANSPGSYPWAYIPSINPSAEWIWFGPGMKTSNVMSYCRLTIN